jgi:hypothetical protein
MANGRPGLASGVTLEGGGGVTSRWRRQQEGGARGKERGRAGGSPSCCSRTFSLLASLGFEFLGPFLGLLD